MSQKYDQSNNVCEHFEYPPVAENIYRSSTAINRPITGEGEEGVKMNDK
jgi:hypothetical protein